MSINQIRSCLEEILHFMQPYWEFVNCHMVSYLTEKHWHKHVPVELRNEVPDVENVQRCIKQVFWNSSDLEFESTKFTAFKNFLFKCEQHCVKNRPGILTPLEVLRSELALDDEMKQNLIIKDFMSAKKGHEVELTAVLVDRLVHSIRVQEKNSNIFIVDAGDGKGYLSSRLALQYGHRVLGIDFQKINTENALERNRKLQRAWNSLVKRAELQQNVPSPRVWKKVNGNANATSNESTNQTKGAETLYKTIAAFITPDMNLKKLLTNQFPDANENNISICLTGLHTCGNLAPTCLRLFHEQPECRLICNIGCCYHLLQEIYVKSEYFENESISALQTSDGFPMSQFLRDKQVALGRNARMLATQSLERVRTERSTMNISLFYRALLEVLICEHCSNMEQQVQVGKIRKFGNFAEYVDLCSRKIFSHNTQSHLSAELIEGVEKKFANDAHYMHLFYLLRMSFAQVLESLILLDRLLYLKELQYEKSYLISVFDEIISPRHFAIVALKEVHLKRTSVNKTDRKV